jgi:hypothetical protein
MDPTDMTTLTEAQVAEMFGMTPRAFQQMNSSRKPTRLEDKTYLRSEVIEWLGKRGKRRSAKNGVALAPVPAPAVPLFNGMTSYEIEQEINKHPPIPRTPVVVHDRGRIIDNEDEHVLAERLRGRGITVKIIDKAIADMRTDEMNLEKHITSLKKTVGDLERQLTLKRASIREYQETRQGFEQEAVSINDDLEDANLATVLAVEAEMSAAGEKPGKKRS